MKRYIIILTLLILSGCSPWIMIPETHDGVCRHECMAAAIILQESYPGRVVIVGGPVVDGGGAYHCQTAVKNADGSYKFFTAYGNSAVEVPKDIRYQITDEYSPKEFFGMHGLWVR